jgi:coiled-coil domain-containing protein 77
MKDASFNSAFMSEKAFCLTHLPSPDADKTQLLNYYRSRLDQFEKERDEWLEKLEGLRVSQENHHRIQWEVKKRNEEIYTLQQQMSEMQLTLFSEREQIVALAKENDRLRLKESEDQRRLMELMAVAQPVEQDVTYFEDRRPEVVNRYPGKARGSTAVKRARTPYCTICKNTKEVTGSCSERHTHTVGRTSSTPRPIVRTIYLPNEQSNVLVTEVDMLKRQLEQDKALYQGQIDALKEDRNVREEEFKLRHDADQRQIEELLQQLQRSEDFKVSTTRDYLRLRHESQTKERSLIESLGKARQENDGLLSQVKHTTVRARQETREAETIAEQKSQDFAHKFRKQAMQKEENLQIVKEQYGQLQTVFSERINDMENKFMRLSQKYRDLENKRKYEAQHHTAEVDTLRQELKRREESKENPPERRTVKRNRSPPAQKLCERCQEKFRRMESPEKPEEFKF